jgi:hypothetical protein
MTERTDLDARLQRLIADAVADAPAAPAYPPREGVVTNVDAAPSRDRWPLWTAIAAAAVSLTTIVIVLSRDDAARIVSSSTTDSPVPSSISDTTTATSTTVPPVASTPTLVIAGPGGVSVRTGDDEQRWTAEPMSFAVRMPDGSLLVQRNVGLGEDQGWTEADTTPLLIESPGTEPVGLFANGDFFDTGWWRVHDVALVDGQTTVLIERQESQLRGLDSPPGSLIAIRMDTTEIVTVDDQFGGWEQGSNRLRLAGNGLIVGVAFAEASWSLISYSLGVVPPVTAAQVGLEDSYFDCTCPSQYTTDRSGTYVAWEVGGALVVTDLATGTVERYDLPPVNGPVMGIELGDGIVVIDRYNTWQPMAPLVVDLETLTSRELTGAISADIA